MEEAEVPLDLLVKAVLDGQPVDWDSAESSASNEEQRTHIRHFRTVATIAALHRESGTDNSESTAATELWGSLRLLESIGKGSFGEVYRAWDTKLDREVALKLLRDSARPTDPPDARALDEGRRLARVRHPNVVTVFGADRIDGRIGIWMEFVRGRTLEQVLATHGLLSAREATAIGLDLCRALSAVHRAGLLHRDVKAQNVMREDGGRIVLMDFGAGRERFEEGGGELAGTPLYIAPEILAGAPTSIRSDLYSLGVLLYHLVTGTFPVGGRLTAELRDAHRQNRRVWLRDARPDLPQKFVQVLERALAANADERFESAGAMELAMARAIASDQPSHIIEDDAQRTPAVPERRAAGGSVGIAWIVVAASVAAVFTAASVFSWRGSLFGRGGAPPGQTAAADAFRSDAAARRLSLPDLWRVGTPSRDGTLFSGADSSGNVVLYDLRTGTSRRLTSDAVNEDPGQSAEFSVISPDDRFVAYTWFALDGKTELRVIGADGKHLRVLTRTELMDHVLPQEWSSDGRFILATVTRPDHSSVLALVSAVDGAIQIVKELGTAGAEHASISPDGEFIVYDAYQQPDAPARDIFIIRADGTSERRLVEHPANDAAPVWTDDGGRVLFVSDRSGTTMDLWSIAVAGGAAQADAQLVHRGLGKSWLRGLTATGAYFYYATVGQVDVYQADLTGEAAKNITPVAAKYVGANVSSVWSPDGRQLAFGSRSGRINFDRESTTLAINDIDTGAQHEVVPGLNNFLLWSWSPDGRGILAQGKDARGVGGNYLIDPQSGQVTPLMVNGRTSEPMLFAGGTFMPDGRLLYVHIGRQALFARDLRSGTDEIVFDLRAEQLRMPDGKYKVAPDGATLAFSARPRTPDNAPTLIALKVIGGGPWRELVRARPGESVSFQDWTPDGQAVLFVRWAQPKPSLWRMSIHGGEPQPLGLAMEGLRDVRVNPSGTRITFTAGWPMNELWVLENFLPKAGA